jgi:hypothetical protein
MRNTQNVLIFGLKFGAFAALAASLSSCIGILTISNSDISNVRAQPTYCAPIAGGRTNLDLEFNVNNDLVISQIEVAFLMPPSENFDSNDANGNPKTPIEDNEITDPLKSPNSYRLVSTTIIGSLTKSVGGRTFRAAAALEVVEDGNGSTIPTVLNPIQAKAINVKGFPGRVWVRGTTESGFKTAWAKAAAFTEGNLLRATCDSTL